MKTRISLLLFVLCGLISAAPGIYGGTYSFGSSAPVSLSQIVTDAGLGSVTKAYSIDFSLANGMCLKAAVGHSSLMFPSSPAYGNLAWTTRILYPSGCNAPADAYVSQTLDHWSIADTFQTGDGLSISDWWVSGQAGGQILWQVIVKGVSVAKTLTPCAAGASYFPSNVRTACSDTGSSIPFSILEFDVVPGQTGKIGLRDSATAQDWHTFYPLTTQPSSTQLNMPVAQQYIISKLNVNDAALPIGNVFVFDYNVGEQILATGYYYH